MYKIGYISLNNELGEQYKKELKSLQCHIEMIDKERTTQLFANNNNLLQQLDTLIIEDYNLNNLNWVCELIMSIRKQTTLPLWIIASSEKANRTKRIVYLQLGADGIIDHGQDMDESLLMMRNLLKRFKQRENKQAIVEPSLINGVADFKLVPQNLSVCVENGKEVNLTKLEFLTIEYLHKHARKTKTYEEIYQNVWNDTYQNRKYRVSNLVFHLRQKLELDIDKPKYIKTIRSKGYMLNI
ncbi:response regulator transcription factor [Enterococcus ureilyticus]|uniref:winged helix-turn-helix domain-containing protein n=1 Tax=Enterococcus ureilyticus TaxID=1131292 RepID=UPI001A911306|nr:winged helix-turn-helix domain-containing protein [Enterococcus ureilyticus]MBO0446727.1 response regulator transcription factor [Enterococcus ureilyticus]